VANRRFLGISVAPPSDRTLQDQYAAALAGAFGPQDEYDTGNYYDALYVLAYAAYAAGLDEPLTGPRIAGGMQRLAGSRNAGSTPFSIAPDFIRFVFQTLDDDGTIALSGTVGPLEFEEQGFRPGSGSVFCYAVSASNSAALRKDVLVYVPGKDRLELWPPYDTFPCGYALYP